MERKTQKLFGLLIIAFAILFVVVWREQQNIPASPPSSESSPSIAQAAPRVEIAVTTTNAIVARAVDGDTLIVKQDSEMQEAKVRLLGVNTPESVDPRRPVQCFGKEASKHMATLAEGRRARLEPDLQADERDKYGRLLRNVILADGTDLNAALIRDGFAYAYLSFPMDKRRKAELRRLQEEAKSAQRGLWNPDTCAGQK